VTTETTHYLIRVKGCPMPYRIDDHAAALAQFERHTWPARLFAVHTDGTATELASTM
jgi:hypothetical protein